MLAAVGIPHRRSFFENSKNDFQTLERTRDLSSVGSVEAHVCMSVVRREFSIENICGRRPRRSSGRGSGAQKWRVFSRSKLFIVLKANSRTRYWYCYECHITYENV